MSNLFYVTTPYHLLLCYMIALSNCKNETNVLVFGDNVSVLTKVNMLFGMLFPAIFSCVYKLEDITKQHNNLKLHLIKKRNILSLKKIVDAILPVKNFYYSCDWKLDVTYLSHLLIEKGTHFCYFEDGLNTYINQHLTRKNYIEQLFDKLCYGRWRENTQFEGLLNAKADIYVMYPELLPKIFSKNNICRINRNCFLTEMKFENIPDELKNILSYDICEIVNLPDGGQINDAYISMMKREIGRAKIEGKTIAIKKHPTALYDSAINELFTSEKVINLPAEYPSEIYYLLLHKSLKRVVGFTSTAMVTAKMLLPEREITVLYTKKSVIVDRLAPQIFDMFKKIGIELKELQD